MTEEDDEIQNYKFDPDGSVDDEAEESDYPGLEEDELVRCVHCGAGNHPEAMTCRKCKLYLTKPKRGGKPAWVRATIIIMLILAVLGIFWGWGSDVIHFDFPHWKR